jgi:hypothetical protein
VLRFEREAEAEEPCPVTSIASLAMSGFTDNSPLPVIWKVLMEQDSSEETPYERRAANATRKSKLLVITDIINV